MSSASLVAQLIPALKHYVAETVKDLPRRNVASASASSNSPVEMRSRYRIGISASSLLERVGRYSAEEKIRIVLDGLREHSIAELCRREGIAEGLYYSWSKEFLEAGKRRLADGLNAMLLLRNLR